jgi:hypothetical protein
MYSHVASGYVGNDYPRQWPIEPLDTVHMPLENSVHYNPQSETGHAEWSTLLPNNNTGIIHLGPTQQPFSISLFHHLRCLDILRVELYTQLDRAGQSPPTENEQSDLIHHCMGYIRQMLLCHSETRLESVKSISASSVSSWDITHTCKDWTAVFRAAKGTYESS